MNIEELQKICQQAREMAQEKNLSKERVQAYMSLARDADVVIMMDMIDDAVAPMLIKP